MKAAGREDPDVILVGEMRDLETIAMALSAAERGTLVFGTLHTNNAAKTMDRIISVFPASEQEGARNILGETIRAVVAQQLMPKIGGGRVAAMEILFASPAIGNMIREGKTSQVQRDSDRRQRRDDRHGRLHPPPLQQRRNHRPHRVRQVNRQGAVQGFAGDGVSQYEVLSYP